MPLLSLERRQKLLLLQNLLLLQKRLLRNLESHCLMNNSVLQKCSSVWSYYKKTGNCSLLYPHDQVTIISISHSVLLWKSFKLFCFVSYIDMFYIMQFYFFSIQYMLSRKESGSHCPSTHMWFCKFKPVFLSYVLLKYILYFL